MEELARNIADQHEVFHGRHERASLGQAHVGHEVGHGACANNQQRTCDHLGELSEGEVVDDTGDGDSVERTG